MKATIFDALKAIQDNNMEFFRSFQPEDAKKLTPYLLLLWVRHPLNEEAERLLNTNEFVNPFVFSLHRHGMLLYQLFCVAQSHRKFTRFLFDKKVPTNMRAKVVADYEEVSLERAKDRAARLPSAVLIQMAQELGWSPKDVEGLKS